MENPHLKWMMTGGTTILGPPHVEVSWNLWANPSHHPSCFMLLVRYKPSKFGSTPMAMDPPGPPGDCDQPHLPSTPSGAATEQRAGRGKSMGITWDNQQNRCEHRLHIYKSINMCMYIYICILYIYICSSQVLERHMMGSGDGVGC